MPVPNVTSSWHPLRRSSSPPPLAGASDQAEQATVEPIPARPVEVQPERTRHARERQNERSLRFDSMAVGVVNAATPFLPVLVARLGGSGLDLALIGAASALGALVLAVPIGAFLETRSDLVRWFSISRLIAWLGYGAIAALILVVPRSASVAAVIVAWFVIAAPTTIGQVAFTIVMNDVAGPGGRYELLGRRWATMGLTTAVAVAVVGVILDRVAFPMNYQLALVAFSIAGLIAFRYERRLLLVREPASAPIRLSRNALAPPHWRELVDRHRPFVRYLVAHAVVSTGAKLVVPVVTLYYVRGVHASDAAIGLILTASSLATFAGFHAWRRLARLRGGRFVLLTSALLTAAWPALLGLAPDPVWAGGVTALGSAGTAGLTLALFDELMRRVSPARAMALSAVDYAATNAVGIAAPLAGALLADRLGLPVTLALGTVAALVGVALFARERSIPEQAIPQAARRTSDSGAGSVRIARDPAQYTRAATTKPT